MKKITNDLINARKAGKLIPAVTAHSGCEGTRANSIAHVEAALRSGADFCEVDVYPYNSVLYLTHDSLDDYRSCPTLDECFSLAQNSTICFNLDMKRAGSMPLVIKLAEKYAMQERITVSGSVGDDDFSVLDGSPLDWFPGPYRNGETLTESLLRLAEADNKYRILNMYYKEASDEFIELTKKHNVGISFWTVNEEADIRRLMLAGAMNITTCRPVLALSVRKEVFGE